MFSLLPFMEDSTARSIWLIVTTTLAVVSTLISSWILWRNYRMSTIITTLQLMNKTKAFDLPLLTSTTPIPTTTLPTISLQQVVYPLWGLVALCFVALVLHYQEIIWNKIPKCINAKHSPTPPSSSIAPTCPPTYNPQPCETIVDIPEPLSPACRLAAASKWSYSRITGGTEEDY